MEKCKYTHTERAGLYIMVFIILCCTCPRNNEFSHSDSERLERIEAKLDSIIVCGADSLDSK